MATMIKEKRKEKKKPKEKDVSTSSINREPRVLAQELELPKDIAIKSTDGTLSDSQHSIFDGAGTSVVVTAELLEPNISQDSLCDANLDKEKSCVDSIGLDKNSSEISESYKLVQPQQSLHYELIESSSGKTYHELNSKLSRIFIPKLDSNLPIKEMQDRLENPQAYMKLEKETKLQGLEKTEQSTRKTEIEEVVANVIPSAPVFEEEVAYTTQQQHEIVKEKAPRVQCMPLQEAIRLFGEREMAEVRAMSEREEAIVEAGPVSGPQHPLVDLLSTFRSSLRAVDRERLKLAKAYADEEKFRNSLWKIEKRLISISEKCPCGATVSLKASYDHAELLVDRLPVAKLKLEGLLRDVQDSYCHHQHTALLAHCQIEELISETIQSSKSEIREALALVLEALRMSDNAPAALATALQRWAAALASALLDGRDLRQLLHLLHHLFRQTRSVRWASELVRPRAPDGAAAAQTAALLDILLARHTLEPAAECTEDAEGDASWEEVDPRGGGCAVSEGALREHDLRALLRALPLRELVARAVLVVRTDITKAKESDWGDSSNGRGVLKACCGIRTLLAILHRGVTSHPHYSRLQEELRELAVRALHALAGLHEHSRQTYSKELTDKVAVELEACFSAGLLLLGNTKLHELPASLLADDTAREYCFAHIVGLHDKSSKQLDRLAIQLPALACEHRVGAVTQASIDRCGDHELARVVLEFLFQTGIKKKTVVCKGSCDVTAREQLPRLLAAHSYLHTIAFHILADLYQVEILDPSSVDPLTPGTWRPNPAEMKAVLEDWAQRCPPLIPNLLSKMDYTPHTGVFLETQLTIGSWLCAFARQAPACPEWAWRALRALRVHRSGWSRPLDAPPPDAGPADLFTTAYAVLASSWGHCIPLICSEGVSALCQLASARVSDAVHCLGPVMLVMAHSPESVSLTPRFNELFNLILKSGPTIVQRALGIGPVPGTELLTRLILTQLETDCAGIPRSSILSVWLHALWRAGLPGALAQVESALLASRDWPLIDAHAAALLQEKNSAEYITAATRNVHAAPLVCECILRGAHAELEARPALAARLLDALHAQRVAGDRAHVDRALRLIGAKLPAEELVIYRCGWALLAAPLSHPSTLMLWRLFFHLYLQRPPVRMHESTPPIGPLFFSGIRNSRLLAQIRRRLQETITYHHTEAESLKQKTAEEPPQRPSRTKAERSSSPDEGILPTLDITDLTGESSDSDDSAEEESEMVEDGDLKSEKVREDLFGYHSSAEIMCKEWLRWLEEGESTRAAPPRADVARYVPERALSAAWDRELSRQRPAPLPEESPLTPTAPTPPASDYQTTPFQKTMDNLMKIEDYSTRRVKQVTIKSALEGAVLRDPRSLLAFVDTHLADIEALAREWCTEVSRIAALDGALWSAVTSLRAPRPLPPVPRRCANNCKPVTIHIPHEEWCISSGAERGIKENRRSARALVRRVARPRPRAARTAAALTACVRYAGSAQTACGVLERAWRCARAADACPPARCAVTSLTQLCVDLWVGRDGKLCAEVLSRWCRGPGGALQQALAGALVVPQPRHWPAAYCAILNGTLAAHATFSYLSKFEMSRWSSTIDPAQRQQLLDALAAAAQRWGPTPDAEYLVLLELIGVHTASLVTSAELCALVTSCARASVACALPASHWAHVTRAAQAHANLVTFDQLGHLLRSLGAVWWEARAALRGPAPHYVKYSAHIAALLSVLQRAFVAAAVGMSYAPERVALYAWSSLLEAWGPWVSPAEGVRSLLPASGEGEVYVTMLKRFVDNVHQIMLDCPGTEESLLQHTFEWAVQLYLTLKGATCEECRGQVPALLEQLAALPWGGRQWMAPNGLQVALQVCASGDSVLQTWCSALWRDVTAESWSRGDPPPLAPLLYLFTAMTHHTQTLEQATRLPWYQLPEAAVEEALDRFFVQYHNPSLAYHDLPQFRVLLFASELCIHAACPPPAAHSELSRSKRGAAISRWVRAATASELIDHVKGHSECLLNTVADLGPYLAGSPGEAEELLSRAVLVLGAEPAASAALPVWLEWVSRAPYPWRAAGVSAAGALTAAGPCAALADCAARAVLSHPESRGWAEVSSRWRGCPWLADPAALAGRARAHAAYGAALALAPPPPALRAAAASLLPAHLDFIENDAIISVWICYMSRVAVSAAGEGGGGGAAEGEGAEYRAAALSALGRLAADRGRSLRQLVSLQPPPARPTDRQRLLARLALCIINNSEETIRAYESACTALLGSNTDVLNWGRTPLLKRLPRLAMRLYPNHDKYFQVELDSAPDDC